MEVNCQQNPTLDLPTMVEHEEKTDIMQDKPHSESSGSLPVGYDIGSAPNKTGLLTAMIVTGLALAHAAYKHSGEHDAGWHSPQRRKDLYPEGQKPISFLE